MKFQATFHKYGEHIHVPVEADTKEQAFGRAKHDNPMLEAWPLTLKPIADGEEAKDDRAELKFPSRGRPVEREGRYRRITLEIREDLLAKIDASYKSRREYIESLLERE